MVVTNTAGWVHIDGTGPSLHITVGQSHAGERGSTQPAGGSDAAACVTSCPGPAPG